MNIVILGAGNVGLHIATILSKDNHNVFLVDRDPKALANAALELDIATRQGTGTDWQLLEDLLDSEPQALVAVTNDDETNLVACSIAKQLGYPQTIARIRDTRYLNPTRLDFARIFSVDHFVAPEVLVADDILKYILLPGSTALESFAHGAVQLRSIIIPEHWKGSLRPLSKLKLPTTVMVGLIRRFQSESPARDHSSYRIIIPHGDDVILPGDEVMFVGETDEIAKIPEFFGVEQRSIHSVVIAGGSGTAVQLASRLTERDVSVRIIEKDFATCCRLSEELRDCGILHHDPADIHFLDAENIGETGLFVACMENDEANICTGLLAKDIGCGDILVMLSSTSYITLTSRLGLANVVSPRVSAANRILSLVLSQRVTSVVSFFENQIEVVEIKVSANSRIVGIPLSELGPLLPKDFLIAMIQNRGRIMIANGTRIISPGDTIVAISTPTNVRDLARIF